MKILYVHGFGSKVDPESSKYKSLEKIGSVFSIAPNYSKGFDEVLNAVYDYADCVGVELIVGTSMGGYIASYVADLMKIPFVAVNPPRSPSETLKAYLNDKFDYYGNPITLTVSKVKSYPDFNRSPYGLAVFNLGDEILDHSVLINEIKNSNATDLLIFGGGDHRFSNFDKIVDIIETHYYVTLAANSSEGFGDSV